MPLVFPAVAPYALTTVRLHPRPGSPTVEQSSVGGPLLWPLDEPWPTCDGPEPYDHLDSSPGEAAAPLVPVVQLLAEDVPEVPFPEGADVLQVLWCPFDHDPSSAPRPELRWRSRAGIGARRLAMPVPDEESDPRYVPDPCVLDPERVIEYPTHDLPQAVWSQIDAAVGQVEQDTGWSYEADLAVASGIKVGGYPGWTQSPQWPVCGCGTSMRHLLTIASWEFSGGDEKRWVALEDRPAMVGWGYDSSDDHPWRTLQNPAGLMLGDAGGIYLFVCTTCPNRPFDHRFDCS
ncbi:hypothetical protein GCM10027614_28600 [Micromonospora vulcania]